MALIFKKAAFVCNPLGEVPAHGVSTHFTGRQQKAQRLLTARPSTGLRARFGSGRDGVRVDPCPNIGGPIANRTANLNHPRAATFCCGDFEKAPGQAEPGLNLIARKKLVRLFVPHCLLRLIAKLLA
jgi:hypothetical protein